MGELAGLGARLLDAAEVAAFLGVSRNAVYDYVEAGALQAIRLRGRTLRFRTEHVQAFVASRETAAPMVSPLHKYGLPERRASSGPRRTRKAG